MRLTRLYQVGARLGDNPEKLRTYYQDVLGAHFVRYYNPPGLMFFDFSGARLMFEAAASPATLYFWVDDIDAAYASFAERGVKFSGPPHMIFPDADGTFDNPGTELWMAFFEDPGGNTVAIATQR